MLQPNLPSEDEIRQLPAGAIVALAVRCARMVEPLVAGSKLSEPHRTAVAAAIDLAEQAGILGPSGLASLAIAAGAAGAAARAAEGFSDSAAAHAARAAAFAIRASEPGAPASDTAALAGYVLGYAADAARARCSKGAEGTHWEQIPGQILSVFRVLQQESQDGLWSGPSPVPARASTTGASGESGRPAAWEQICIAVSAEATAEEVGRLLTALARLHRNLTGENLLLDAIAIGGVPGIPHDGAAT